MSKIKFMKINEYSVLIIRKILLLIILFLVLPLNVFAKEYVVDKNLKIDFDNSNWYVFTRSNIYNNPELEELGLTYNYLNNLMMNNYIYLDAVYFDELNVNDNLEIFIRIKDAGKTIKNLHTYSDEEIEEFSEELVNSFGYNIVDYDIYSNEYKYIEFEYDDLGYNLYQYYTIINGKGYNFMLQKKNEITTKDRLIFKNIIDTVKFNLDEEFNNNTSIFDNVVDGIVVGLFFGVLLGIIYGVYVLINKMCITSKKSNNVEKNYHWLLTKALNLYMSKKYDESKEYFEKYINEAEKIKEDCSQKMYNFDNLIQLSLFGNNDDNFVNVNFNCPLAYYNLALMEFEKKEYRTAIRLLNNGLMWNPCHVDLLFEKAENYKALGEFDKFYKLTLRIYNDIYSLKDLARYYRNLGYYNIEIKNWELAKTLYLYSIRFDNNDIAHTELAYILEKCDNEFLPPKDNLKNILKENNIPVYVSDEVMNNVDELSKELIKTNKSFNSSGQFVLYINKQLKDNLEK